MNRRTFLRTAAAGAAGLPALASGTETSGEVDQLKNTSLSSSPRTNGDEERFRNLAGQFGKGLPHDEQGLIAPNAYASLKEALAADRFDLMEAVPLGGRRKLANPLAAKVRGREGRDPRMLQCPPPPSVGSRELADEMAELRWMSRLRDVPFDDYHASTVAQEAWEDLSGRIGDYAGAEGGMENLFRKVTHRDAKGPYVSQFLLLDFNYGASQISQRYKICPTGADYLKEPAEWLRNVRGFAPQKSPVFLPSPRYLTTGRDLAECVHRDFTVQHFINAALILLGGNYSQKARRFPFAQSNPYPDSQTQAPFCTFGEPEVLDLISQASTFALEAAWYQKWVVHCYLRPEEYAGRLEMARQQGETSAMHMEALKGMSATHDLKAHGNLLLSQTYPEGCPLHPSYPSGHAAISGACATVLKACFDEETPFPRPMQVREGELKLLERELRTGDELDKLAMNIAMGRNFAGIHWRCDAREGIRLGEKAAMTVLGEARLRRVESQVPFRFTSVDGVVVKV